jgi:hypothetical protein
MIMFGLAISDKQGRVGQAKPGFPHFADEGLSVPSSFGSYRERADVRFLARGPSLG